MSVITINTEVARDVFVCILRAHEGQLSDGFEYYVPGKPTNSFDKTRNCDEFLHQLADEFIAALTP